MADADGIRVETRLAQVPPAQSLGQRLSEALEAERPQWGQWTPVLVAAGALAYFSLPEEPGAGPVIGVVAGLLGLAVAVRRVRVVSLFAVALLVISIGIAAAKVRVEIVRAPIWAGESRVVGLKGVVEHVDVRDKGGVRLLLRPWHIDGIGREGLPHRVRVTVRTPPDDLAPGAGISVRARLSAPPTAGLPGGFEYARFAYFQGIGAVGFVVEPPRPVEVPSDLESAIGLPAAVAQVRKAIGERVTEALPGPIGGIATALITGERGGIPEDVNDAFRASGLFHVLSISGLHMTIMGGSVLVALRALLALVPALALRFPIKKWAAAGAIVASFCYLLISGGAFATVRSFLMILVMLLAVIADRPAIAMRNVATAALIILLVFPESVIDVGFQMSFAAVVALVAGHEAISPRFVPAGDRLIDGFVRPVYWLGAIVGSTLLASAAVAPLGVYHFQQTQHYAVLGNLLGVPICNLVIMPAALAGFVLMPLGLEALPLTVMGAGIEAMVAVARWVASLGGAVGRVPAVPDAAILLFAGGGLWLAIMRLGWRWAGLAGMAAGLVISPLGQRPDVLISEDGRLVAVRDGQARLAFAGEAGNLFVVSRWLERDGDGREPDAIVLGSPPFTCDAAGCVAPLAGRSLALASHPAALDDDCRRADVLIYAGTVPNWCRRPSLIVDAAVLAREGAMSLKLRHDGTFEIDSVRRRGGIRPWSPQSDSDTLGGLRGLPAPPRTLSSGG